MKDKFFGFYPPDEKEIEEIWENGIIAFDANTLLNLYRYSKSTKNDFIKTLTDYSERIWLPYQAGYEFHNNRISVIKSQEESYLEVSTTLDNIYKQIVNNLNQYKRHPIINIDKILNELLKKIEKIKNDLIKQSNNHPEYLKSDDILPSITELFVGKTGENFSESELQKIFDEGKERYIKKIPPGYSDESNKKNKGNNHLFGDLIIWKQLIQKSKKEKNTIIFVTDDRKDDWWLKFKGKTIRPREELIKEFYNETGFRILIYQADIFLNFANTKLQSQVKETSINEVEQIRIEDELEYYNYDHFNRNSNPVNNSMWLNSGIIDNKSNSYDWLDKMTTLSNATSNSEWLEKITTLSNATSNPEWLEKITTLSKATSNPEWLEKITTLSNATSNPEWLEKMTTLSKIEPSNMIVKIPTKKTSGSNDKNKSE